MTICSTVLIWKWIMNVKFRLQEMDLITPYLNANVRKYFLGFHISFPIFVLRKKLFFLSESGISNSKDSTFENWSFVVGGWTLNINMSLQWTLVAGVLYAEIGLVLLLLLPFISPTRWNAVFKSRIVMALSTFSTIYFRGGHDWIYSVFDPPFFYSM